MSVGSKVVLLVSFGFIGLLIWYYGGTPPTVADAAIPDTAVTSEPPAARPTPTLATRRPAPSPAPTSVATGATEPTPAQPTRSTLIAAGPESVAPAAEIVMGEPRVPSRTTRTSRTRPTQLQIPAIPAAPPAKPTTSHTRTVSPATGVRSHTVQPGDTLSEIAERYLGSHRDWYLIVAANTGLDENNLRVGKTITIPARVARKSTTPPRVSTPAPAGSRQHTVADGDSLSTIADQYYGHEKHWTRVFEANRSMLGGDPDRLRIGMVLVVPR
ncbi:MAG: LysM peptidoglycan-binding domain-containing protein [Phycisphaerales bacterium]|nr:LysM peptidoglycan-binding domain-containing protein [Phycisphaerales bacterium]